jgi:non-specific serine/threonine protein kinase/serine/threonine-protein kinase
LRGDLDAIVLKAMRKEPGERYASARELAGDLTRFFDGDPVLARAPSALYVLRRLAARHKPAVTLAAVALIGVLTASGVAIWQWQTARRAQDRAEQRFREVRQLANALIFKIHDAVTPLPGSTPVRQTIVNEALAYMERLDAESGDDPALRLELAAAYRQIGGILGDASRANLGDREGAVRLYERAREMVMPLAAGGTDYDAVAALGSANRALGSIYSQRGDGSRAMALARESLEYATRYLQSQPAEGRAVSLVAGANFMLALGLPPAQAVPEWEKTLALYERQLAADPNDAPTQRNVALAGKYLGTLLEQTPDLESARRHYARSLELDEKRLMNAPDDQRVQFDAAISYSTMASVFEKLGDVERASPLFEKSLALRRKLVEGDPMNVQARGRLGYLLARLAASYRQREPARADAAAREAVEILGAVVAKTGDRQSREDLGYAWLQLGFVEKHARDRIAACTAFRRANEFLAGGDPVALPPVKDAAREADACRGAEPREP